MNATHVEEAVAKAMAAPMAMIQQLAQQVHSIAPPVLVMDSSPPPESFCGGYNPHRANRRPGNTPLAAPYPVRAPHAPAAAAQAPGINVIHEASVTEASDLSSTISSDGAMTGTTPLGTGEEVHLSDADAPTESEEPPQMTMGPA